MSFKRRVKYGNVVAKRKLKQKITSERVENMSYIMFVIVSLFAMKVALLSM